MINSRSWEDVLDLRGAYMKTGGKDLRVWECVSGMHSALGSFWLFPSLESVKVNLHLQAIGKQTVHRIGHQVQFANSVLDELFWICTCLQYFCGNPT